MSLLPRKKKRAPEEVFTPRAGSPNDRMYVPREDLEGALARALAGNKHVIVHGESGSGKSWLYKQLLEQRGAKVLVADMANASRFGSITDEFRNIIDRRVKAEKVGYSETKSASGKGLVLEAGLAHEGEFVLNSKEPFERCLEWLRKQAGKNGEAVLVWDNFERVIEQDKIVREAADLISLADNEDYAAYKIKTLIVGVPSDLRTYIAKSGHVETIANRLTEIPEVERLTSDQARLLVTRGLVNELGFDISTDLLNEICDHVVFVTDRVPQHIHEYCLELANIAVQNGGTITSDDLRLADEQWMGSAMVQSYSVVEMNMNSRNTTARRRDQTIFAIGLCTKHDFTYSDIEEVIRREFPDSTDGVGLNVSQTLSGLSQGDHPLLKSNPKGGSYRLVNPKIRMCIRTILSKDESGQISKMALQSE